MAGIIQGKITVAFSCFDKYENTKDIEHLEKFVSQIVDVADNSVHSTWQRNVLDDAIKNEFAIREGMAIQG